MTDIVLMPSDLEMLEQRVVTARHRCAQQQDKIRDAQYRLAGMEKLGRVNGTSEQSLLDDAKHKLREAQAELADRQRQLERDMRICDAIAELMLDPE